MSISVIIPYYNESETILLTLRSLACQSYEPDEVLLIDSGSTDKTSQVIDEWIKENKMKRYQNIYCGMMSPSSSVNKGIKSSKNKYIAYIDCGLEIPEDWLLSNYNLIKENRGEIVSVVIYTIGKNIIDQSFISQTYGYEGKTICLPGSLINKDLFDRTGYLMDSVRAGYDVAFANQLKKLNIKRLINQNIVLKYYNYNYCQSFVSGFKKVYMYSLSGWKTKGDVKPIIYISIFSLSIVSIYIEYYSLLIPYILLRGFLIPFYKSNFKLIMLVPHRIIFNCITGIIIDISRLSAYMNIFRLIKSNG